METMIYYILTFVAGSIISYFFAKAKFDSPEFQEKAEALEKKELKMQEPPTMT